MTNDITGFAAVPHWVMRGDKLKTTAAKLVYICLLDHADRFGQCFPSVPKIAAECCMSKNTTLKALREIEAAGLVERVKQRRADGGATSNLYQVNVFDTPVQQVNAPSAAAALPPVQQVNAPSAAAALEVYTREVKPSEKQPSKGGPVESKYLGEFAEFRAIWVKKVGTIAEIAPLFDAAADTVGVDNLMTFARNYVASVEDTPPQYTKSPRSWLGDSANWINAGKRTSASADDRSEGGFNRWWEAHYGDDIDYVTARRIYWGRDVRSHDAAVRALAAFGDTPKL